MSTSIPSQTRDRSDRARDQAVRLLAIQEAIEKHCPDLTVRHGPFAGMAYPEPISAGGELFPKLLGCYEAELHRMIESACRRDYTEIINIGCAEGYYAVGLALLNPSAAVYAFDRNGRAQAMCRRMADFNGIGSRLTVGGACDAFTLLRIPVRSRALVFSDCEGYERHLFTRLTAGFLRSHDLLIETHDCLDISISTTLRHALESTHSIEVVESVDDIKKAKTYSYPELDEYTLAERYTLLAEKRRAVMEWFMCRPKK